MKDCDLTATPASNHFLRKPAFRKGESGTKNGPGIRARFWSLLASRGTVPKAQKTGLFLGPPHFGAGKHS